MVQAILDGRKTQTRRVVKLNHHPNVDLYAIQEHSKDYILSQSPYGQPGDMLWVREAYSPHYFEFGVHGYKADWQYTSGEYAFKPRWTPSIHMLKDAARIWLKVVNVRVERLQDIKEQDARDEGVELLPSGGFKWYGIGDYPEEDGPRFFYAAHSFASLWDSINEENGWNQNPWVWVIEFEVVSKTGRPS